MSKYWALKQNYEALKRILDENEPPVARLRTMSQGISTAHCLPECDHIAGDKSCFACGNCVDVCPQVLRKHGALTESNNRTSMYLETVVGDSCIRCYSCIGSCPQIDKQLKNFAVRFRLVEKIVHWFLVMCYFGLAVTGIGLNHFRGDWSETFVLIIAILHRIFGVGFVLSPIIFYIFDRDHMKRILRHVFSFGAKDIQWLKDAQKYITGKDRDALFQGEFNLGQKIWYLIVIGGFFVLGLTGIAKFAYFDEPSFLNNITWVHIVWAVAFDVGFVIHLYRKLISRNLIRYKQYTDKEFALSFKEPDYQRDMSSAGGVFTGGSDLTGQNTGPKSVQV
jgi:formate dehydrogenase gamma subunit